MNVINEFWRQLVRRRLWPVALLLAGALVAVPVLLTEDPEPRPTSAAPVPAAAVAAAADADIATQPIVTKAAPEDRPARRKVLGKRHDIFASTAKATKAQPEPTASPTPVATPATSAPMGSSTASAPSPTTTTTTVEQADAKPDPAPQSLLVKFGSSDAPLAKRELERLEALPSAATPRVIYLGVLEDGETAVFLIEAGVVAQGDGRCRPLEADCETIELKAGETEFFDVVEADGTVTEQYQLDLLEVHAKKKAAKSAKVASAAKATSAEAVRAGRRALRAHVAAEGTPGYRFDAATGALERVGADDLEG